MTVESHPLPPIPVPCRTAICIPAHGEPHGLQRTLASIAHLDYPSGLLQVIVAVDGPDPVLVAVAERHGADVEVLDSNRGSYAARNAALQHVDHDAEVVAFVDADVEVSPGWLSAHVAALQRAHISGGAFRFRFSDPPRPAEHVDSVRHLKQQLSVEHLGYVITGNFAARKKVFDELRFDERLRSGGDRDFGIRARGAGWTVAYAEDAWVWHEARSSTRALLKKVARIAAGIQQLRAIDAYQPAVRNYRRISAVASGRQERRSQGLWWDLQVVVLDQLCNLVWARRAPSALLPAIARRLSARSPLSTSPHASDR